MLDKTIEALVKDARLAIVVIGVVLCIIGAAGGLPIGSPPLQVSDPAWRIGLAAMGMLLVGAGLLSMLRASSARFTWTRNGKLEKQIEIASKDTIPIDIKQSISYSQLYRGLERIEDILDKSRFIPDVIVCIHYMGTAFGAILGHIMFKPIYTAVVKYRTEGNRVECEGVFFSFKAAEVLKNKSALIVDNSIHTGRTLRMVHDEVRKYTSKVKTFVVHQRSSASHTEITPDYVLFRSVKPVRLLA